MEQLAANTADPFSDPAHRMSQRPLAVKSGQGLGFQDMGSTFGPTKPTVVHRKTAKSKFKPGDTYPSKVRTKPPLISEDESDDELLLGSQKSTGGDATSPGKSTEKGKKRITILEEEETIIVGGREIPAHPDFKPSKRDTIKALRFKKSSSLAEDAVVEVPPPSSSLTGSQDHFKWISDGFAKSSPSSPSPSCRGPSELSSTRPSSPNATYGVARQLTNAKDSSIPSSSKAKGAIQSSIRPRPKPRVVIGGRDSSTLHPPAWEKNLPIRKMTPELPTNVKSDLTVKKPHVSSIPRREPQESPVSLQAKENASNSAWSGDASSTKTKKAPVSRSASLVNKLKQFPVTSPLGTKRVSGFPNLSPLSSSEGKCKVHIESCEEGDANSTDHCRKPAGPKPFPMSHDVGHVESTDYGEKSGGPKPFPMSSHMLRGIEQAPAESSDVNDEKDRGGKRGLKPFPMSSQILGGIKEACMDRSDTGRTRSTDRRGRRGGPKPFPLSPQMLAGIDRRSNSPSSHSFRSSKRTSSEDSGAEQGRGAKKLRDLGLPTLDTLDYLQEPMEDDSIDLGHARDASKLCPYCDEELPSPPTPFLQHLLATARKKSAQDPRPRNRCGLKAPLAVYISVCQRHRFESHQLPIATKKGWPKTIDFTKVPVRIRKMKQRLEAIILDKDDIGDIEKIHADGVRRPRNESVFWKEVMKEVKKQGSRTVLGVKGQFASFDKAQPGYYGEQGSVIIHQTLFDIFPPSTFDASLIAPLSPAEFIQRILVPEAAVRLIAQDLCVNIEDAIVTLRESSQYGVAMFPDTSESKRKGAIDDDEMGVADRIVMERARARRKELAEEERLENEMLEEQQAAQRARARDSRRKKALARAEQARRNESRVEGEVEAEDASEASKVVRTRRTRQGVRQRSVTGDSESDAMSVDSSTSKRIAKKGLWDSGKAVKAILQLDDSDSDSVDLFGDPRLQATNRSGKARERDTDSDTHVLPESERKKPFSTFASLNVGGEYESTPRPTRQRTTDTTMTTAETAAGSSDARILPLQIARNRVPSADTGWSRSLRTTGCDDSDSDASPASRRLEHPKMKKGGTVPWLWSTDSDASL